MGFRAYYPAIGRFTTIDPMAERFYSQSPYVYAANNPVRYIDFLGLYPLGDGFPNWGEGSIPVNFPTGNYNLTVMGPRIGENGEYIIGGGGGFGGISMPGGFSLNWQNYYDHEAWIRANRFNRFVENLSKWNPLSKPIDPSKPNHEHSIITTPLDLILTGGGENIPFWFGGTNKFGDLKGPHLHLCEPTVYDNKGNLIHDYTGDENYSKDDNSVYVAKKGWKPEDGVDGLKKLGEFGGNIDVSDIMKNLLGANSRKAKKMGITDYFLAFQRGTDWDLKANKKTIFGLAVDFDSKNKALGIKTETTFSFGKYSGLSAYDVNNYHAGYMGRYAYWGIGIPRYALWKGAGFEEARKEWKYYSKPMAVLRGVGFLHFMWLPSGDRLPDFIWNTQGMNDADINKFK